MPFQVIDTDGLARTGILNTKHGKVDTPAVFPVHNLGADAGWNTPKYWEHFPEMNTAMFNASYLYMDLRHRLRSILEKGIHDYIGFPGVVFVDSGGFIYSKYNLTASQKELLKIQEHVGADIASTLDQPIVFLKPLLKHTKITESVNNAKQAAQLRKDKEMLLFASLQGYDPLILRNIVRHLDKRGRFDGFALGSLMKTFSNYRHIVDLVVAVRREVPNKPLHVYGLGGVLITPILIYLGVDSTDSSVFVIAAGKRDYIVPNFRRVSVHEVAESDEIFCQCPICSSYTMSQIKDSREYLALHNLWAIWHELSSIKCAIKEKRIEDYLEDRFNENPWAKKAFRYAQRRLRLGLTGV